MRRLVSGALAVGLLALPGCVSPETGRGSDPGAASSSSPWGGPSVPGAPTAPPPEGEPGDVAELLRARAAAVLVGDRTAFLAPVRDAGLRAEQARLFDNLRRLPIADLSFEVEGGAVVRDLRLEGADSGPVRSPAGFGVERTERGLAVVRGPAGAEPWDLVGVGVQRAPGVLLVHDRASSGQARDVARVVSRGRPAVEGALGRPFDGTTVVYLFRDPAVIATYQGTSAAASVVAATAPSVRGPGGERVGTRVAVLPRGAELPPTSQARLMRHELVHVLLPEGDDAPTWLVEGLAEHIGYRAVPRRLQGMTPTALDRARSGRLVLPTAEDFAGADGLAAYGIAWMAAEQIAVDAGTDALVDLVRLLSTQGFGGQGQDVDGALLQVVGYDGAELARRTSARLLRRFGG